ncbi:hypothetical protein POVCU2_0008610 [Plasmodium ovale curtisi]|uniref:Uncharacterized protein n=1 Tax=Plasmodium ovale curtisi TaxID=864141 RepID=A0A1A8VNB4_PLAOA|nr:hypothetical protein POVCU2_0008610 [Plasmodium ovale curtisi]
MNVLRSGDFQFNVDQTLQRSWVRFFHLVVVMEFLDNPIVSAPTAAYRSFKRMSYFGGTGENSLSFPPNMPIQSNYKSGKSGQSNNVGGKTSKVKLRQSRKEKKKKAEKAEKENRELKKSERTER